MIEKVLLLHNIAWPRYRGSVFTSLVNGFRSQLDIDVKHLAATEGARTVLGQLDLSNHRYPYEILFDMPYESIPRIKLIYRLMVMVSKREYRLVILPGYHRLEHWFLLVACLVFRKKIGVFCDSTANEASKNLMKVLAKKLFFNMCDIIFVYGIRSRQYLNQLGVNDAKIKSGCQAAAPLPGVATFRSLSFDRGNFELIEDGILRILFVGRLAPEKGLSLLLNAASLLDSEGIELELHFCGDGPLESLLRQSARELGLQAKTLFHGAVSPDALAERYKEASLLVLPSTREPWGLVVNEALSFGCPVVVSDICGCVPELVVPGATGVSFRNNDVRDLVSAIKYLRSKIIESPSSISMDCVALAARYTPEHAAQHIGNGCLELLSKNANKG